MHLGLKKTKIYLIHFYKYLIVLLMKAAFQRFWSHCGSEAGSVSCFVRTVYMTVLNCRYATNTRRRRITQTIICPSLGENSCFKDYILSVKYCGFASVYYWVFLSAVKQGVMPDGTGWKRRSFYIQPSGQHLKSPTAPWQWNYQVVM